MEVFDWKLRRTGASGGCPNSIVSRIVWIPEELKTLSCSPWLYCSQVIKRMFRIWRNAQICATPWDDSSLQCWIGRNFRWYLALVNGKWKQLNKVLLRIRDDRTSLEKGKCSATFSFLHSLRTDPSICWIGISCSFTMCSHDQQVDKWLRMWWDKFGYILFRVTWLIPIPRTPGKV